MMLHYEDHHGREDLGPFRVMTSNIIKISSIYAERGAKLSYQFDKDFSERIVDPDTQLHLISAYNITSPLALGHNYWVQVHCGTLNHALSARNALESVFTVDSAYTQQQAQDHILGISGGLTFDNDLTSVVIDSAGLDWYTVAVSAGYQVKNSVVWANYAWTPTSLRPYRHSTRHILKWYLHESAPVPYHIPTYRTVYWMANVSQFHIQSNVSSLGHIPTPSAWTLAQQSRRFFAEAQTPNATDFQYAVSQIVSLANNTTTGQTNSYYLMMGPGAVAEGTSGEVHTMHAEFIDTVNYLVAHSVGAGTQKVDWANMNEIWSDFLS